MQISYNRRIEITCTGKTIARHCYAAPAQTQIGCGSTAAEMRKGVIPRGSKNPLPFPFSCLRSLPSAPKPLREKGRFTRGWKTAGCLPSCAPAARSGTPRRGSRQNSPPGKDEPQKLCLRIPVREYDLNAKNRPAKRDGFREVFTFSCPEALCDDSCRRNVRNRRCSRRTS